MTKQLAIFVAIMLAMSVLVAAGTVTNDKLINRFSTKGYYQMVEWHNGKYRPGKRII